jgi:hypothetical protein
MVAEGVEVAILLEPLHLRSRFVQKRETGVPTGHHQGDIAGVCDVKEQTGKRIFFQPDFNRDSLFARDACDRIALSLAALLPSCCSLLTS